MFDGNLKTIMHVAIRFILFDLYANMFYMVSCKIHPNKVIVNCSASKCTYPIILMQWIEIVQIERSIPKFFQRFQAPCARFVAASAGSSEKKTISASQPPFNIRIRVSW